MHKVTNNGAGPRGIRPKGVAVRLLEKGESFTGEFDPGEIAAMNRPGRMLKVTEAASVAEADTSGELKAVHRGGGSYSIMRGDEPIETMERLDKEQAQAFNDLSDDEKVKFVAEHPAPAE